MKVPGSAWRVVAVALAATACVATAALAVLGPAFDGGGDGDATAAEGDGAADVRPLPRPGAAASLLGPPDGAGGVAPPDGAGGAGPPAAAALLVRAVDPSAPRADAAVYELGADGRPRRAGSLRCKRLHVSAAGPGLCLTLGENRIDYDAVVFDADYEEVARFPADGVPDRARVSPDGRYGAYTGFDSAGAAQYFESTTRFDTHTRIVDMRSGRPLLRLERLEVFRRGESFGVAEPQLWGVTFGDRGRYYATLAGGGDHYLIAGRVGSRRARVIARRVECPSLSPDGARIAYKRRIGYTNRWRLHVRDLASGDTTALAETRSIDDQPEWLGDDRIVYSDDRAVFAVRADGAGAPERIASRATSPVAVAR